LAQSLRERLTESNGTAVLDSDPAVAAKAKGRRRLGRSLDVTVESLRKAA
jgi:hypothetical protein